MKLASVLAVSTLLLAAACGDDEGSLGDAGSQNDAAPGADGAATQAVTINFAALADGMPAVCGTTYANQGTAAANIEFIDMRFYVSGVRLVDDQSNEVRVTLDQASNFQTGDVALLDFEDATGACDGTAETNTSVTGTVPTGTYSGVVFELGVPFAVNHEDVTAAPTPLNVMALYWAWLTGHKFAKIDVQDDTTPTPNRWNFHLGSTNCDNGGGGPTAPPSAACGRVNLPTISLAAFDPASDTINVDLSALFSDSDFTVNTMMTPPGCQSFAGPTNQGNTDPDCTDIFANVGLDLDTGACANNCDDQTVFAVAP